MKKYVLVTFYLCLTACVPLSQPDVSKTQLQVREFQTRTFDTSKTNEVLTAVVEAFQDQGYMVKNVIPQVGLVSADREVDLEDPDQAFLRRVFLGKDASWRKNALLEATANVKTLNGKTKVRATFQEKVMNNQGNIETVNTIEDPKFYQAF